MDSKTDSKQKLSNGPEVRISVRGSEQTHAQPQPGDFLSPFPRKPKPKSLLDNITQDIQRKMRQKFLEKLVAKSIPNPRKLRLKEFDKYVEERVQSVTRLLREAVYRFKKLLGGKTLAEGRLAETLQESVMLSSLAGKFA